MATNQAHKSRDSLTPLFDQRQVLFPVGDNYSCRLNVARIFVIFLDKAEGIWFNECVMRQINRKNTANWWWPAG